MKIEIVFSDDDGRPYRTMSAEGSRADIAHGLIALAAEWKRYALAARVEQVVEEDDGDDGLGPLVALVGQMFGEEKAAELRRRITEDETQAFQDFGRLLANGEATLEDLPQFIMLRVRAQVLSVIPGIPEHILDQAFGDAVQGMQEYLRQHGSGSAK